MKSILAAVTLCTLHSQTTLAFTPIGFTRSTIKDVRMGSSTQHSAIVDPSVFTDISHNADAVQSFFSSLSLSDAAAAVAENAGDVVEATKDPGNGWFGFLEGPIETTLCSVHDAFVGLGITGNAWGLSIIVITSVIKLFTYPLTAQQLKSTSKMQTIQPKVKELQDKYASNPEVMNQKVSQLYQTNEINPLAGCIPSLVQIPVFIGLYRAVLTLAKDNKLAEPFLFLPNLEGPTYGADPQHASEWILKGWVNGVPSLGWADTAAYLSVPIILIISQGISMQLMAPKDQEQPAYLKFLPLLIGWFSLNVPSALGIYWVANNIITTALTLQIKSGLSDSEVIMPVAGGGGAAVMDAPTTSFNPAPIREKPDGFASGKADSDGVTPITPMDAEIMSKTSMDDLEDDVVDAAASMGQTKRSGTKKKKKKRKKKN